MSHPEFLVGSGNIFADIGLPNAEEHLAKAQLVVKIDRIMNSAASSKWRPRSYSASGNRDVSKMLRGEYAAQLIVT